MARRSLGPLHRNTISKVKSRRIHSTTIHGAVASIGKNAINILVGKCKMTQACEALTTETTQWLPMVVFVKDTL